MPRQCGPWPPRAAARAGAWLTVVLLMAGPAAALAAPEEIEVYRNEMNAAGEAALETNFSYVFDGVAGVDYPGQQPSPHRYRVTPELVYGLAPSWEAGTLAVITRDARGRVSLDGVKARLRFLAPTTAGLYWGGNLEVGRVAHRSEPNPWGAELRGILGYDGDRLILAVNPTLEWTLDGPSPEPLSLDLQSKLGWKVSDGFTVGLESYNSLGPVRRFSALRTEEQMLYLTADVETRRFEANIGVGHGLTGASDGWVVKMVIGAPLHWP